MPFIVATYVSACSQGQRTHSARTNNIIRMGPALALSNSQMRSKLEIDIVFSNKKNNMNPIPNISAWGCPRVIQVCTDIFLNKMISKLVEKMTYLTKTFEEKLKFPFNYQMWTVTQC